MLGRAEDAESGGAARPRRYPPAPFPKEKRNLIPIQAERNSSNRTGIGSVPSAT